MVFAICNRFEAGWNRSLYIPCKIDNMTKQ
jgi:hypothetical protein